MYTVSIVSLRDDGKHVLNYPPEMGPYNDNLTVCFAVD